MENSPDPNQQLWQSIISYRNNLFLPRQLIKSKYYLARQPIVSNPAHIRTPSRIRDKNSSAAPQQECLPPVAFLPGRGLRCLSKSPPPCKEVDFPNSSRYFFITRSRCLALTNSEVNSVANDTSDPPTIPWTSTVERADELCAPPLVMKKSPPPNISCHLSPGRHSRTFRAAVLLLPILLLCGCASNRIKRKDGSFSKHRFSIANLAKCDIDQVSEFVEKEVMNSLRRLTEKLYKRNPHEFRKQGLETPEVATEQLFSQLEQWPDSPLRDLDWQENFQLSFLDEYPGDRVYTFMSALLTMVMSSYNHKQTFFFGDSLDAQKLYNSARNIETAAWKLSNATLPNGQPYLLTNSMDCPAPNLSFEREFGKLIADQDLMALIMEGKTNRVISRVFTGAASFIFLPI